LSYSELFVKSQIFVYPTLHSVPQMGWPHLNFAEIFGIRKLESLGYCMSFLALSYV